MYVRYGKYGTKTPTSESPMAFFYCKLNNEMLLGERNLYENICLKTNDEKKQCNDILMVLTTPWQWCVKSQNRYIKRFCNDAATNDDENQFRLKSLIYFIIIIKTLRYFFCFINKILPFVVFLLNSAVCFCFKFTFAGPELRWNRQPNWNRERKREKETEHQSNLFGMK